MNVVTGWRKILKGKTDEAKGKTDEAMKKIRIVRRSDKPSNSEAEDKQNLVKRGEQILLRIEVGNAKTGEKAINLFYVSNVEIAKLVKWFTSKGIHVPNGTVKEVKITIE